MKAIVVYDSLFGNTAAVGEALARGLRIGGMETACANVKETKPEELRGYDLIALGAPTQAFSASKPMKDFLDSLRAVGLSGKWGFAFDTKLDFFVTGSASSLIEKKLRALGVKMLLPHRSALVAGVSKEQGRRGNGDARLKEGMAEQFERLGVELAGKLTGPPALISLK